jgi:hypothetical protein
MLLIRKNLYIIFIRIFSGVLGLVENHPDSQIKQITENDCKEPSDAEVVVFCICSHSTSEHSDPKCNKCDCKEFKLLV